MNIGIVGGGQLARMLAMAAYPLGLTPSCFERAPDACAQTVCPQICADYQDTNALNAWLANCDVITFDNENIPQATLSLIESHSSVHPNTRALRIAQDRLLEKDLCQTLQLNTARYCPVESFEQLMDALDELGYPALLKTRRLGYDGKGQQRIQSPDEAKTAWETSNKRDLLLEAFVPFEREVSLIAVRNTQGDTVFYPLTENTHRHGVLRLSQAPYHAPDLQQQAEQQATRLLDELRYVGTFAIEFFHTDNTLLINEIAPRVHNSGHWTIEGAACSQFENHLRAISGLPLGSTETYGYSTMINCLGQMPAIETCLQYPNVHYHDYGKTPRENRKVGHITINSQHALDEHPLYTSLL